MNWLIIAAGGSGQRMNLGHNKIFAKIHQLPIIYWTLKAFEKSPAISHIIISAQKGDIKKIKALVTKHNFKKVKTIMPAADSRQNSTYAVLKELRTKINDQDLVGIHNAVNPFVSQSEIKKVFAAAKKFGAALLAIPAKDTVKIASRDEFVNHTPLRQLCWYAQTPQVASFKNLWQAFKKADQENFIATDDTQLMERNGVKVKIVTCASQNIKITYPEDLFLAEQICKNFKS